MSYVSNYENETPRTKGILLAGFVHAVVIAGVMAMPAIEVPIRFPGTVMAIPVPVEKPPEPVIAEKQPEKKPIGETNQQRPVRPVIALPPAPPIPQPNFARIDVEQGLSGSAIAIPLDPVILAPDPVVVAPSLNRHYARHFQPAYPAGQLRLEQEAVVSVRVLVGTDGRVKRITLIDSPHPDFWKATRKQALTKWRFTPGTEDGKPVESWMSLKVLFEIKD